MRKRALALTAALVAISAPLKAQSLFNSAGLGLPMEALDGRARALGSFGIGLPGPGLMPSDPAAAAGLLFPTGVIAGQPSWVDVTEDATGESRYFTGSRFPLLGVAYPAFSGVVTIQLGAFLDQRFRGERAVTVTLGGVPIAATDVFEQDGAVSTLNVGFARMVGEETSVGLTVGRYAGSISQELVRDFGSSTSALSVDPFESTGSWSYSGQLITGGVATDLAQVIRVAASVTWSAALEAEASEGSDGADRSFHLPLQMRVGASAVLAPGFVLSASAVRADWSVIADDLSGSSAAASTTGFGVGIELSQVRVLGKEAPFRFGFRSAGLPFSLGTKRATERIFSGGLALTLNETDSFVLASADLAIERGRRADGTITENFWRGTASLRVSGF